MRVREFLEDLLVGGVLAGFCFFGFFGELEALEQNFAKLLR